MNAGDASPLQKLITGIKARQATVTVIGLGYAGLPLALRFAEVGFQTIGIDIDEQRVACINRGQSGLAHLTDARVAKVTQAGRLHATTDIARIAEVDAVLLCLPTPLDAKRAPDLSAVLTTACAIAPYLHAGQLVALESTTWPGTTEEALVPRLLAGGDGTGDGDGASDGDGNSDGDDTNDSTLRVGENFFVVFSPEREDPGNAKYGTANTPRICGGVTAQCLQAGLALYQTIVDEVVPVSSTRTAEMVKLLENTYRAVNIALVNELKMFSDQMGLDIFEIVRAAATKPFGFIPFYPGPGPGGHCIPVDPLYLACKAREYKTPMHIVELADSINEAIPGYVVARTKGALQQAGKNINDAKIFVLGVAYKKNIDDTRESPGLRILAQLREAGAHVLYSDPFVPHIMLPGVSDSTPTVTLHSVAVADENIHDCDCIVIVTDHDQFEWPRIKEAADEAGALIIDTRGIFAPQAGRIVRA